MKIAREKICLYTLPYPRCRTVADMMHLAAGLGLGGVELRSFCEEFRVPDREKARELGKLARSLGLSLPCFSVSSDFVTAPEKTMEALRGYAEICSDLEIPYLHHTVALEMHAFTLPEEEKARRFAFGIECALAVCDYAERLGVRTLIEDQGFVFNGVSNCARLCERSGDRIGIVADVGNILFVDERPEDFIRAMKGRVCHAHLKDFARYHEEPETYRYRSVSGAYLAETEIGTGDVDLATVMQAFADISYDGYYSLEFSRGFDEEELARVLARLTAAS